MSSKILVPVEQVLLPDVEKDDSETIEVTVDKKTSKITIKRIKKDKK